MNMTEVDSSQLHSIGFDAEANRIHIRFKNKSGPGACYTYPCSAEKHAAFMAAESLGKFFGEFKNAKDEHGNLMHPHTKLADE